MYTYLQKALNKNSLGVNKDARPIRSNAVNGYKRPKILILSKAKKLKLLSKNAFTRMIYNSSQPGIFTTMIGFVT